MKHLIKFGMAWLIFSLIASATRDNPTAATVLGDGIVTGIGYIIYLALKGEGNATTTEVREYDPWGGKHYE